MAKTFGFPTWEGELPLEYYLKIQPSLHEHSRRLYTSGSVTGGPGRKLFPKDTRQAIVANFDFADRALAILDETKQLDQYNLIVSPFTLVAHPEGSQQMAAWKERGMLTFWIMVIAGMSPTLAATFFAQTKFDLTSPLTMGSQQQFTEELAKRATFNDYLAPTEKRRHYYRELADLALVAIWRSREISPVVGVLQLPGVLTSLGCWLESYLAFKLKGVCLQAIEIYPNHPKMSASRLANNAVVKVLQAEKPNLYCNFTPVPSEHPIVKIRA